MSLFRIIWANARQRWLSTLLTSFSVALGTALITAILLIKTGAEQRLAMGYSGFDMVVGAKGSPLQLVLNVVYHLDVSPGNIPWSMYEKLRADQRVTLAVPFAMGDSYAGHRIVGTSDEFLQKFHPAPGENFQLADGRWFHFSFDELREALADAKKGGEHHDHGEHAGGAYEAIVGATAAEETGLKTGSTFLAAHGVNADEESEHHHQPWTVVGILRPTGTPADRAIYINLDSFYRIEGHELPASGELSAIGLVLDGPLAALSLHKEINTTREAQATFPADQIRRLLGLVGNVNRILLVEAALIVIVSAIGTGLALFNSMKERRRDLAILRALGANRWTVCWIVLGEAGLISALGALAGGVAGHMVVALGASALRAAAGFAIPAWTIQGFEPIVLAGVWVVGALAGLGPALAAYRTDVAGHLSSSA
ncbi:MAG: ABC transporter permease [Verrucomicrobiae bacterium]|nr:ABC transporter permease [Verrucomicrobiae bacterium]